VGRLVRFHAASGACWSRVVWGLVRVSGLLALFAVALFAVALFAVALFAVAYLRKYGCVSRGRWASGLYAPPVLGRSGEIGVEIPGQHHRAFCTLGIWPSSRAVLVASRSSCHWLSVRLGLCAFWARVGSDDGLPVGGLAAFLLVGLACRGRSGPPAVRGILCWGGWVCRAVLLASSAGEWPRAYMASRFVW